jgi:hypothetical protein
MKAIRAVLAVLFAQCLGGEVHAGPHEDGFPGAHYDYRAYVGKHNQPFSLGPVSIYGEDAWKVKS